jgi:hypothetical protein
MRPGLPGAGRLSERAVEGLDTIVAFYAKPL